VSSTVPHERRRAAALTLPNRFQLRAFSPPAVAPAPACFVARPRESYGRLNGSGVRLAALPREVMCSPMQEGYSRPCYFRSSRRAAFRTQRPPQCGPWATPGIGGCETLSGTSFPYTSALVTARPPPRCGTAAIRAGVPAGRTGQTHLHRNQTQGDASGPMIDQDVSLACGGARVANPPSERHQLICRVSSAVEQRFCKPLVGSSNLSPGTIKNPDKNWISWH
jgi:hypothetical protein